MKRKFQPTAKRTRIAFALVAALCSVMLGGAIQGLAGHYQGQAQVQLAAKATATVAQR